MKSNKRNWEKLLSDPNFDSKIQNSITTRFQKEKSRNRMIYSMAFTFFILFGSFGMVTINPTSDDFANNVGFMIEEYDSNPLLYLSED